MVCPKFRIFRNPLSIGSWDTISRLISTPLRIWSAVSSSGIFLICVSASHKVLSAISACLSSSAKPLRHSVSWKGLDVSLTVTEFMLLQALAQRPGFVKSRDQLMDVAYDDQVYVDDRTIDSHIKRLRKKFKMVDTDFDMIETLYGVGYRFREAA